MKMAESVTYRKHWWKRRNCSLQTISPFPCVFKRLVLQTCKNQGLFGKGSKELIIVIMDDRKEVLMLSKKKIRCIKYLTEDMRMRKKKDRCKNSIFSQCSILYWGPISSFGSMSKHLDLNIFSKCFILYWGLIPSFGSMSNLSSVSAFNMDT